MIANVSPAHSACEQTFNTLSYAQRLRQIQTNKAGPSVVMSGSTPSRSSQKASIFHPSKIQCSSTPLRQKDVPHSAPVDLNKILNDASDTPIRGHRLHRTKSKQQRLVQNQQTIQPDKHEDSLNRKLRFESPDVKQPESDAATAKSNHILDASIHNDKIQADSAQSSIVDSMNDSTAATHNQGNVSGRSNNSDNLTRRPVVKRLDFSESAAHDSLGHNSANNDSVKVESTSSSAKTINHNDENLQGSQPLLTDVSGQHVQSREGSIPPETALSDSRYHITRPPYVEASGELHATSSQTISEEPSVHTSANETTSKTAAIDTRGKLFKTATKDAVGKNQALPTAAVIPQQTGTEVTSSTVPQSTLKYDNTGGPLKPNEMFTKQLSTDSSLSKQLSTSSSLNRQLSAGSAVPSTSEAVSSQQQKEIQYLTDRSRKYLEDVSQNSSRLDIGIGEEATKEFLDDLAEIRLTHTWMLQNKLPDLLYSGSEDSSVGGRDLLSYDPNLSGCYQEPGAPNGISKNALHDNTAKLEPDLHSGAKVIQQDVQHPGVSVVQPTVNSGVSIAHEDLIDFSSRSLSDEGLGSSVATKAASVAPNINKFQVQSNMGGHSQADAMQLKVDHNKMSGNNHTGVVQQQKPETDVTAKQADHQYAGLSPSLISLSPASTHDTSPTQSVKTAVTNINEALKSSMNSFDELTSFLLVPNNTPSNADNKTQQKTYRDVPKESNNARCTSVHYDTTADSQYVTSNTSHSSLHLLQYSQDTLVSTAGINDYPIKMPIVKHSTQIRKDTTKTDKSSNTVTLQQTDVTLTNASATSVAYTTTANSALGATPIFGDVSQQPAISTSSAGISVSTATDVSSMQLALSQNNLSTLQQTTHTTLREQSSVQPERLVTAMQQPPHSQSKASMQQTIPNNNLSTTSHIATQQKPVASSVLPTQKQLQQNNQYTSTASVQPPVHVSVHRMTQNTVNSTVCDNDTILTATVGTIKQTPSPKTLHYEAPLEFKPTRTGMPASHPGNVGVINSSSKSAIVVEKLASNGTVTSAFTPVHPFVQMKPITASDHGDIASDVSDRPTVDKTTGSSGLVPKPGIIAKSFVSSEELSKTSNIAQLMASSAHYKTFPAKVIAQSESTEHTRLASDEISEASATARAQTSDETTTSQSESPAYKALTSSAHDPFDTPNSACSSNWSRDSDHHKSQILFTAHEEQLGEVTSLCKDEMRLLMDVKIGRVDFEEYVSTLRNILASKTSAITALMTHIDKVTHNSEDSGSDHKGNEL